MITEQNAIDLVIETLQSLQRSGLIGQELQIAPGTILLGAGSAMDSLAFVTFIAELEDKLSRVADHESSLVLSELHDFNAGAAYLDVKTMARFVAKLANGS